MGNEIGTIEALYRYPVKSMAGEQLDLADLGWHGLDGDRRFAFRRVQDQSGFPWLTAGKLPELILYKPVQTSAKDTTHVTTPDGSLLALDGDELRQEIAGRLGASVQLMRLKHGIFDETPLSLLAVATVQKIADEAGEVGDIRRFRPNVVIRTVNGEPFAEDQWLGKAIVFGDGADSPAVNVALRDERCSMIGLHPDTAQNNPSVLKSVVRLNQNCAGVYCMILRPGRLRVGEKVYLKPLPQ